MKRFDLISDVHLDFWVGGPVEGRSSSLRSIDSFADSLLPEETSEVLAIAGDLGHFNEQNFNFLQSLKRYYPHILLVAGNHDYYLVNSREKYKHRTSMKRWSNMKRLAGLLDGVHFLEGDICEIGGVRFGGTGMWYDFSYGTQVLGRRLSSMIEYWAYRMNDGRMTIGLPQRPLEMFWREKMKLNGVIDDCDVIITHVSPDWSRISDEHRLDPLSGCYYFDGSEYMERIGGKIWCSGHSHRRHSYANRGCRFVNNALGYPMEEGGPAGRIVPIPLGGGTDPLECPEPDAGGSCREENGGN